MWLGQYFEGHEMEQIAVLLPFVAGVPTIAQKWRFCPYIGLSKKDAIILGLHHAIMPEM
jgi:hypothetical protein